MEQTWRLTLDRFNGAIELRRPPLLQVVHVKYYDAAGVQRAVLGLPIAPADPLQAAMDRHARAVADWSTGGG